ncbi:hypothetical protein FrEUN1fDRAFT_1109 [Parafrankia sp. EUN1f]|nr:hypothetical protein FrEUN1fDRAFT_1109 [Parafrankia sp. EUN1f]
MILGMLRGVLDRYGHPDPLSAHAIAASRTRAAVQLAIHAAAV